MFDDAVARGVVAHNPARCGSVATTTKVTRTTAPALVTHDLAHDGAPTRLHAEREVFDGLCAQRTSHHVRLEQERIPWDRVIAALLPA